MLRAVLRCADPLTLADQLDILATRLHVLARVYWDDQASWTEHDAPCAAWCACIAALQAAPAVLEQSPAGRHRETRDWTADLAVSLRRAGGIVQSPLGQPALEGDVADSLQLIREVARQLRILGRPDPRQGRP
jgi:hypothetical protein